MWNDSVITNAGKELLARWVNGGVINITRAATGAGTVVPSALMEQTKLVAEKQAMSITSSRREADGVRVTLQITGEGITNPYMINQIGIWARLDDEPEVLMAIYQDALGVSAPSHAEMPDYIFTFSATLQMSNEGKISVSIDQSAVVDRKTLDESVNKHNTSSDAHADIRALLKNKADIVLSDVEPDDGPVLWINTSGARPVVEEHVIVLQLGGEGDVEDAEVQTEVSGKVYPVDNSELEPAESGSDTAKIKILD